MLFIAIATKRASMADRILLPSLPELRTLMHLGIYAFRDGAKIQCVVFLKKEFSALVLVTRSQALTARPPACMIVFQTRLDQAVLRPGCSDYECWEEGVVQGRSKVGTDPTCCSNHHHSHQTPVTHILRHHSAHVLCAGHLCAWSPLRCS